MTAAAAALAAALFFAPPLVETRGAGVIVRHPAAAASQARDLVAIAPAIREELEAKLGLVPPNEYVVDLALDRKEFEERVGGGVAPWAAGVTFPREARMAIRLDAVAPHAGATLREVFRHEAVHVAFASLLPARVPRWFEEGVAQWFAGRLVIGDPDQLAIAHRLDQLPYLSEFADSFPSDERSAGLAYVQSESVVRHMVGRFGQVGVRGLIAEFRRAGDFKAAVIGSFDVALVDIEVSWKEELESRGPLALLIVKSIPLFAFVAFLVCLGFLRARWRRRRRLAQFDAEADAAAIPGEDESIAEEDAGDERR